MNRSSLIVPTLNMDSTEGGHGWELAVKPTSRSGKRNIGDDQKHVAMTTQNAKHMRRNKKVGYDRFDDTAPPIARAPKVFETKGTLFGS